MLCDEVDNVDFQDPSYIFWRPLWKLGVNWNMIYWPIEDPVISPAVLLQADGEFGVRITIMLWNDGHDVNNLTHSRPCHLSRRAVLLPVDGKLDWGLGYYEMMVSDANSLLHSHTTINSSISHG